MNHEEALKYARSAVEAVVGKRGPEEREAIARELVAQANKDPELMAAFAIVGYVLCEAEGSTKH